MSRFRTAITVPSLVAAAVLAVAPGPVRADVQPPPRFLLTDLGTLGGAYSRALGMNDHATVVGWSTTADVPYDDAHAFMWNAAEGVMIDLGTYDGHWTEARAVNDTGQVVGVAWTSSRQSRAVYWYDGRMFDLNDHLVVPGGIPRTALADLPAPRPGTPPLRVLIEANAINDTGLIVACGLVEADNRVRGFLLIPRATSLPDLPSYDYVDLGVLPEADTCVASGLNEVGDVVGESGGEAFVVRFGTPIEPLEPWARVSAALACNADGLVVGWTGLVADAPTACTWEGGVRRDLGVGAGDWISVAIGVDDRARVVGWAARNAGEPPEAMLWEGCVPVHLDAVTVIPIIPDMFPWHRLEEAVAIDAAGRIAGSGRAVDGRPRAFLLTPLPVATDEGTRDRR